MYLDIPNIEQYQVNEKLFFITDNDGIIQFIPFDCKYISDFSHDNIVYKLHYLDLFVSAFLSSSLSITGAKTS